MWLLHVLERSSRRVKEGPAFNDPLISVEDNTIHLTEDQLEVAELGKPRLGEFRKCQITIKESKEFQVSNHTYITGDYYSSIIIML